MTREEVAEWCTEHISASHPNFRFRHASLESVWAHGSVLDAE